MDLDRLGTGEKIAAVSGILLFIFMFFDWFSVSVSGGGFSSGSLGGGNAWDTLDWIPIFLVITIAVAIGHALIEASDTDLNAPLHGSTATTVLGAISVLLILYRIIDTPGGATFVGGSVDVSPTVGIFLSLFAAGGIAFGGYRGMQEADVSFADAADQFSGGESGTGISGGRSGTASTASASAAPSAGIAPRGAACTSAAHRRGTVGTDRGARAPRGPGHAQPRGGQVSAARIRRGEIVAGLGGVVLLVSLFLPWFEPGQSGFDSLAVADLFVAAAALAAIALPLLSAGQEKTDLPVVADTVTVIAFDDRDRDRRLPPAGPNRRRARSRPLPGPGGVDRHPRRVLFSDGQRGRLNRARRVADLMHGCQASASVIGHVRQPEGAPSSPAATAAATRFEKAITVIIGLTPTEVGKRLASATCRPSTPWSGRRCRRRPPRPRLRFAPFPSGGRPPAAARRAGSGRPRSRQGHPAAAPRRGRCWDRPRWRRRRSGPPPPGRCRRSAARRPRG